MLESVVAGGARSQFATVVYCMIRLGFYSYIHSTSIPVAGPSSSRCPKIVLFWRLRIKFLCQTRRPCQSLHSRFLHCLRRLRRLLHRHQQRWRLPGLDRHERNIQVRTLPRTENPPSNHYRSHHHPPPRRLLTSSPLLLLLLLPSSSSSSSSSQIENWYCCSAIAISVHMISSLPPSYSHSVV